MQLQDVHDWLMIDLDPIFIISWSIIKIKSFMERVSGRIWVIRLERDMRAATLVTNWTLQNVKRKFKG